MDFELKRTIERAKKGDEEAFASLISRVQNTGYSVAFRYMENDADTRDVMQEAFIKMYRNLGSFKGDSSFETWFTRILINCCVIGQIFTNENKLTAGFMGVSYRFVQCDKLRIALIQNTTVVSIRKCDDIIRIGSAVEIIDISNENG